MIKQLLIVLTLCCVTTGCDWSWFPLKPYRPTVNQGNVIDDKKLAQLRHGMTKQQVSYLLGNPMATDAFDPNRWEYIYYTKPGYKEATSNRLTLFFKSGELTKATGYVDVIEDSLLTKN